MPRHRIADPPGATSPDGWRAVRHFASVDRPFRDVRRHVAAAPQRIVTEPPADTTSLHLQRGGLDLGRDVRITIGDVWIGAHNARLPLRWEDATRPNLFPLLEATLEITPVRSGPHQMTQLGLFGRYQPPFGRFGALADDLGGHQMVLESVERFLDDLARRLELELK